MWDKLKLPPQLELSFFGHITKICQRAFYFVLFFSFFLNLLMLTVPLYMLQVFNRVLPSFSLDTLIYLTLIAILALAVLALLDITRNRIMMRVNIWLDQQLSPQALARSPDELLLGSQYGADALRDITNVRQFISSPGIFTLFDAPWVPVFLLVIFLLHPILGYIALVGAILLFSLAILNEKLTRDPITKANTQAMISQREIEVVLKNAEIIQAMGMGNNIVNAWKIKHKPTADLQAQANNISSLLLSSSKFLRLVLQLLMLGAGAYLVIQNQLTPGAMIAGTILLSRALSPVEQSIGVWKHFLSARQAYQRLAQHFAKPTVRVSQIRLPEPKGKLSIENVFYRAPQTGKLIINGIDLTIKPGEMLALIGPSGAGKTTLARLMVGAWPATAGSVRLDEANVYTWEREDFGQYVGYLPQDIELFAGTVKDNIARMGTVEDEEVVQAAQLAGVHELILHFPKSYDTEINTHQFILSGGQRQRLALARALYKKPKFIVLDEPNSNLDNEGEKALLNAFNEIKKWGGTCVIISHRPTILKYCDRIAIINEGRVQSIGPRDAILANLQEIAKSQIEKK